MTHIARVESRDRARNSRIKRRRVREREKGGEIESNARERENPKSRASKYSMQIESKKMADSVRYMYTEFLYTHSPPGYNRV